ncbi:MAG: DMT family transporter [Methylococcaceae bacterium]|nr:DMT family transporter [Methylococcaceae bacterium]
MRIVLAYISVILIWATTPLAIKWSGQGPGFLFGVTGRMSIGMVCLLFVLRLTGQRLAWHSKARLTYLAVALQIYGSMLAVYWGAQFIPSGWISVIFGLTPLMTALLSALWLGERSLSLGKWLSYLMGIAGLMIMFASAIQLHREAVLGMVAVLMATFFQAASSVWIKRINAKLPALSQVAGGLLLALPTYWLTWWMGDGHWPLDISFTSLASIVYLGVIATTFGFVLYYYLLSHLSASRVALITLVTPVLSLIVGQTANHELLSSKIAVGTFFILMALVSHEFFDRLTGIWQRRIE